MTGRSPSPRRVLWALVRIGILRWRNRIFGRLMGAFRRKGAPPRRRATAPKRTALGSLQVVMALLMIVGAFGMATGLLIRLAEQMHMTAVPGKIGAGQWVYDQLRKAERAEQRRLAAEEGDLAAPEPLDTRPAASGPPASRPAQTSPASAPAKPVGRAVRRRVLGKQGFLFREIGRRLAGPFGDGMREQYRARNAYLDRGIDAFHPVPDHHKQILPIPADWADPAAGHVLRASVGLVLTGLFLMLLFRSFAAANLDLATPRWSLEWFFTFPIPAGAVFAARLLQLALLNAFSWLTVFPLLGMTYFSAGFGWWAPVAAGGVTLVVNAAVAAVQVSGETWIRRRLSRAQLNNIVGVCTILQMLFFIGTMAVAATPQATRWLVKAAARLPEAWMHLPTLLPLRFCRPGASPWPVIAVLAAVGAGLPVLAAAGSHRLVQGGLISQAGTYGGRRGRPRRPTGRGVFRGMAGKELLLLARDRSFLAQTIVLPIALCLLQVVLNPALFYAASRDLQHATAVAFGTGAYVVLMSGARLLVGEVRGLWLLYTLPERLDRLLFRKIALWAMFGTAFATVVWLLLALRHGPPGPMDTLNALIALAGVGIFGCVSAGLSALGTEATMENPRVAAAVVYLNMLLGGVYVSAVYAPTVWQKAVIVALFIVVACAVWQKVRERIPYLLDPTQLPPPSLGLSDAVICVFSFVAVQSLLALILYRTRLGLVGALAVSYVLAALAVGSLSLLVFWRRKVPGLWRQLGLVAAEHAPRLPWARAAVLGTVLGLGVGVLGAGYQVLLRNVGWLRDLAERSAMPGLGEKGAYAWIVVLAVLAAPPLEEYLFRGLLYRTLLRSARPAVAILASAAIFAAIHPPIAFPAVFCLGIVAALALRATGLLIAPVLAHMTYNAIVTAAATLQ